VKPDKFQKDQLLYQRLFAEIFLYLNQNESTADWYAVVIYPRRSLEPDSSRLYRSLLQSPQVQRVYLDEFGLAADQSLGVGIVQLVMESQSAASARAKQLIDKASQETASGIKRQEIIELIETIIVYKFPHLSRQEVEEMLGLSELKQTRVYQEALSEGRQEGCQEGERRIQFQAVPQLLEFGLSVEQIARALGLDVEAVRQLTQNQ